MSSTRVWKLSENIGQLLNATALTTLSFHLLFARRDAASERAQYTARISILDSLIERLRGGERIDGAEIDKLIVLSRKLRRVDEVDDQISGYGPQRTGVTWKEALLGRNAPKEFRDTAERS